MATASDATDRLSAVLAEAEARNPIQAWRRSLFLHRDIIYIQAQAALVIAAFVLSQLGFTVTCAFLYCRRAHLRGGTPAALASLYTWADDHARALLQGAVSPTVAAALVLLLSVVVVACSAAALFDGVYRAKGGPLVRARVEARQRRDYEAVARQLVHELILAQHLNIDRI